ncbi:MAG: glycoside hydrolase family 5 protein [Oscillospiraceae bacterium]|nr:glycoside hydrolase family 5 protein [Oscillospiraceae bacterium]
MKKNFGKIMLSALMSISLLCGCTRDFSGGGGYGGGNSGSQTQSSSDSNSEDSSDSGANSESSDSRTDSAGSSDPGFIEVPIDTAKTPVSAHGQLSVKGTNLVDKNGTPYQLRGMSTHGLTWFPDFVNEQAFLTLRDDWNTNVVRLAMYVDEWNNGQCYMNNKQGSRELLEKGVELCIKLDMYAIIDWHVLNPGDPLKYTSEAIAFFDSISKKYADSPNVIYEICNEPNSGASWNGSVKPYAEQVIPVIRKNDPDAVIIVGTPTWSQDIHEALANPLNYDNVMYALHFYADTHRDDLRNRLQSCVNGGLPVFVSEFGCCDASGGGGNNFTETEKWLSLLDSLNISYCNWALADKNETCCAIRGSGGANGSWSDSQLSESGKWIRNWFKNH